MTNFYRYIKEVINSIKSNKARAILLLTGTTICIIVACFANMVYYCYNYCQSVVYEDYSYYSLRVNRNVSKAVFDELTNMDEVNDLAGYDYLGGNANLSFYAVTYNFLNLGLPSEINSDSIVKPKFIMGRNFNLYDVLLKSEVAIINNTVAKSLNITLGDYLFHGNHKYRIVGIINDTPDINAKKYRIYEGTVIKSSFNVYVLGHDLTSFDILIFSLNKTASQELIYKVKSKIGREDDIVSFFPEIKNRERVIEDINTLNRKQNNLIKTIAYTAIAVAILFSLIIILFMLKDKAYEIGIKRAIGASVFDIMTQTLAEIVILLIICMIIGSFFSVLFLSIVLPELYISAGIPMGNLSLHHFIFPQLLIGTITVILSVIPISFACFGRIVNVLRFE